MLTVSVVQLESPHETATWAETRESRGHGIWPRCPDCVVLSRLTSILACTLPLLPAHLASDNDVVLINMPIKVLFVLHQKKSLPQTPGANVKECFKLPDYLGASGNLSDTTGVSVLPDFSTYPCYLYLFIAKLEWFGYTQENIYILDKTFCALIFCQMYICTHEYCICDRIFCFALLVCTFLLECKPVGICSQT